MRRPISAAASNKGFTLIEALMSLAILSVVVSVIVSVHLNTLRAGDFSRLRDGAVQVAGTVRTGILLGTDPQSILDGVRRSGWKAEVTPVGEPPAIQWMEWRVASSNAGAPTVTLYMRPALVSTNGPAKGGRPGDGREKAGSVHERQDAKT